MCVMRSGLLLYNTMTTSIPTSAAETKLNKRHTIAYYAIFIALGLAVAALGPILPGLAENTHASLSAISILFTIQVL